MKIGQALTLLPDVDDARRRAALEKTITKTNVSFGESLQRAIADVNTLQTEAGKAVEKMVGGEGIDLHDVMIAVEKAKTSFDLLMEVRNKAMDAYRELMRMQV